MRDPDLLAALESAGRSDDARRSAVAAALDLQEHDAAGRGTDAPGPSGQSRARWATCCNAAGLQPAGQPQDAGGQPASGPRRPVRAHQRARVQAVPAARAAGDLGGHEEEGTGRGLQERRARVAARRASPRRCEVHDFLDPKLGKAIPYGVYDLTRQPGLGERRHRPRHGRVRRRQRSGAGGSRWARQRYPPGQASC